MLKIVFFILSLLPVFASAASQDALALFLQNCSKAGIALTGVEQMVARNTPVKGIYRLERSAKFFAYISENGEIYGGSNGWNYISNGSKVQEPELTALRKEIMRNLSWDKLIPVQYGDGGGRKILMFSAVDCPSCKQLEADFAKRAKELNTTLYVALTSLNLPASEQGKRSWEIVRSLNCANSGKAWVAYWKAGSVPGTEACAMTPAEAFGVYNEMAQIFKSVGAAAGYVPQLTREDGILIPKNEWQKLGRSELATFASPFDDKAEVRWLAAPASPK